MGHTRTFTPNYSPIHPWTYPDLPPELHIRPKWLLSLKFNPIFSGGLGLISVVLISAILAGSGCHVLKKDTQENINELNKFITNLKGTVQKRQSGFIGPYEGSSGNSWLVKKDQGRNWPVLKVIGDILTDSFTMWNLQRPLKFKPFQTTTLLHRLAWIIVVMSHNLWQPKSSVYKADVDVSSIRRVMFVSDWFRVGAC